MRKSPSGRQEKERGRPLCWLSQPCSHLQGMKSSPKALAGQGVVKGSGCHKGLL